MNQSTEYRMYRVVSIEAWRYPEGWVWNNQFHVADDIMLADDITPRALFRFCRQRGWLAPQSAGRVRIQDDFPVIEIQARGTGEPLIAFIAEDC